MVETISQSCDDCSHPDVCKFTEQYTKAGSWSMGCRFFNPTSIARKSLREAEEEVSRAELTRLSGSHKLVTRATRATAAKPALKTIKHLGTKTKVFLVEQYFQNHPEFEGTHSSLIKKAYANGGILRERVDYDIDNILLANEKRLFTKVKTGQKHGVNIWRYQSKVYDVKARSGR